MSIDNITIITIILTTTIVNNTLYKKMTNGITYVISFLISFVLYGYELSLFKTDMTKPALLRCY